MGKKLTFVFLTGIFVFINTQCQSQATKSKTLETLVVKYNKDKAVQTRQKFFDAFPNTFKEFQSIYGYDDVKGASPIYDESMQHINLFFKTSNDVDSIRFATKLVSICSEGKWEADAENYLQEGLREYFFLHSRLMVSILSKSKTNSIDHFWSFFVDGPVFDQANFKKARTRLTNYPEMSLSLAKAARIVKTKSERN